MSFLPESTILGKLEIIEVYDFYDKPSLFSCKNQSGQIFIVVWIDSSENSDIWLYAPVSLIKFKAIRKGKIDLREIFSNSEDAFVYKVVIPYRENLKIEVNNIPCEQIEDDCLPESGQIIEPESDFTINSMNMIY